MSHIRDGKKQFALHEVFYSDKTGKVENWTAEPETGFFEVKDDLIVDLKLKLKDAKKYKSKVLNYDNLSSISKESAERA